MPAEEPTPHVVRINRLHDSVPTKYGWECEHGWWGFIGQLFSVEDAKADHNKHCPAPVSTVTWKVST